MSIKGFEMPAKYGEENNKWMEKEMKNETEITVIAFAIDLNR